MEKVDKKYITMQYIITKYNTILHNIEKILHIIKKRYFMHPQVEFMFIIVPLKKDPRGNGNQQWLLTCFLEATNYSHVICIFIHNYCIFLYK